MVIPAEVRSALVEHAEAEKPNEACGLISFRDGVAERYLPGENLTPTPFRFQLKPGSPEDPFLEDQGYELAMFHSHISSPPRPSRTDVEHIDDWKWRGKLYAILTVRTGELRMWRIFDEYRIEAEPLDVHSNGS